MKNLQIALLTLSILCFFTPSVSAKKGSLFSEVSDLPNMKHTFMSEDVLKNMDLMSFSSSRIKLDCKSLKSYDKLETSYNPSVEKLMNVTRQIIKKEKLDKLASSGDTRKRVSLYGKIIKGNAFSKLLLVEEGPGNQLSVLYLTGKILCHNLNLRSYIPGINSFKSSQSNYSQEYNDAAKSQLGQLRSQCERLRDDLSKMKKDICKNVNQIAISEIKAQAGQIKRQSKKIREDVSKILKDKRTVTINTPEGEVVIIKESGNGSSSRSYSLSR